MKKVVLFVICVYLVVLNLGCQSNKTRVAEGALIGAIVGAGAGGIIGHQSHHGSEGAGIGAAAGALTGALVGAQVEKSNSGNDSSIAGASSAQISTQQVIDLAKQGVNEDVIIDKIRLSGSKFKLSAEDVNYLKQEGVSQKVIEAMQGV